MPLGLLLPPVGEQGPLTQQAAPPPPPLEALVAAVETDHPRAAPLPAAASSEWVTWAALLSSAMLGRGQVQLCAQPAFHTAPPQLPSSAFAALTTSLLGFMGRPTWLQWTAAPWPACQSSPAGTCGLCKADAELCTAEGPSGAVGSRHSSRLGGLYSRVWHSTRPLKPPWPYLTLAP